MTVPPNLPPCHPSAPADGAGAPADTGPPCAAFGRAGGILALAAPPPEEAAGPAGRPSVEELAAEAEELLGRHLGTQAAAVRAALGAPGPGAAERLLADARFVRYPGRVVYAAAGLAPHQFGQPVPDADHPWERCDVHLHPGLADDAAGAFLAACYLVPVINYGHAVDDGHCLRYAAAALGLAEAEAAWRLEALADRLGLEVATA